jgi:diacylglycerol O-acyltransferase-1
MAETTETDPVTQELKILELEQRIELLTGQLHDANDTIRTIQHPSPTAQSTRNNSTERPVIRNKRGYLFKWMDRSIGWSGTKWSLRFATLEHGRISYFGAHTDVSPRYVMSLRGCAVRDDGYKRNRRHPCANNGDPPLNQVGAYFFLFSIYQRPIIIVPGSATATESIESESPDDSEIVPLLRFSTPSLAEKSLWIQLISEACAYCMTDEYLEDERARAAEEMQRRQQQSTMVMTMPEANEGTLPPLLFASVAKSPSRRPSSNKLIDAAKFQTKSKEIDAEKVDSRSTKGYPQSKPMHRCSAPSYLSAEAPTQNYRGFFNLGIIVLLVSNARLLIETIRDHGFVVTNNFNFIKELPEIKQHPWDKFPFVSGFILQVSFVCASYGIEWALSRKKLTESVGMSLHHLNAHCAFFIPMMIVWNIIESPPIGAVLLLHATITWLKLISYSNANEDYRLSSRHRKDVDTFQATIALIDGLDANEEGLTYPRNVTLGNIFYFWVAPTLTYQIAFPKYPHVRWWKVVGIVVRMFIVLTLFTFLGAQVVSPALAGLVSELEDNNGTYTLQMLGEYWLKLSIANTYLWLLMFYLYFHLYLNLFAEILRFGDRVFYKDWWNSSEVSAYWRLWNMPVHYWLIRHLYFPCLRMGMSRRSATFVVFLFSAVMHEILVSVPFHMARPWSFLVHRMCRLKCICIF